jgi:glycosyltransferase involved in cell wall biosynthesis
MAEKKKAVVILTPGFAKNEQDTTCIPVLQQYVSTFSALRPDIKVYVIAFQYPSNNKGWYKWNGVDIYSAGGKPGLYSRFFTWRSVLKELKGITKQNNIAVIHSYWLTECTFIGQRFARKHNIKHIAYAIGQDVLKSNKYLRLLNFSRMQVVAMSESIVNRYSDLTNRSIAAIIPAGIDIKSISLDTEPRIIDIIGVGALTQLKNYSFFVEIIAELKKDISDIKAVIIGKGEQGQLLQEQIKNADIERNIQLIGEKPHNEIFSYMNRSKIFLHTSSYEGQSTVIMEAISLGLPVVCFDVGRVDNEKIKVCKDKDQMVSNLRQLLSQKIDYGPAIVFTTEDTVREFIKLYNI